MQISEHVYFYLGKGVSSNSCVIRNKKQILVDPGTNLRRPPFLFQQMKKDGLVLQKIDEIWLTHAHPDHIAATWTLQKKFGFAIVSSSKAKEVLASPSPLYDFIKKEQKEIDKVKKFIGFGWKWIIPPIKWLFRVHADLTARSMCGGTWKPLEITKTYEEFQSPEIEILSLPGHTLDEVGIWVKDDKVLITGDLIAGGGPVLNMPSSDLDLASESIQKIESLSPETIVCGHGPVVYQQDVERTLAQAKGQIQKYRNLIKAHFPMHTFRQVMALYRSLPFQIYPLERWVLFSVLLKSAMKE
jgi:glyoxylase-like metal-dependent hydrolase (beta-lactamase superfamily II)